MKAANTAMETGELAQLLKGVYHRVSRELGLPPYYISRAARGELHSKVVESALERELKRVLAATNGNEGAASRNTRKTRAKESEDAPKTRVATG